MLPFRSHMVSVQQSNGLSLGTVNSIAGLTSYVDEIFLIFFLHGHPECCIERFYNICGILFSSMVYKYAKETLDWKTLFIWVQFMPSIQFNVLAGTDKKKCFPFCVLSKNIVFLRLQEDSSDTIVFIIR